MKTINEKDFLEFCGKQESQYIEPASSFVAGVLAKFNGAESELGHTMPWAKTHGSFLMRPGEVSLWAGINGHGKSAILNQVCAWSLKECRWLIASLEMKPVATMYRMTRQIAGNKDVADDYVKKVMGWTDGRLWIYDQLDTVSTDRILGMIRYAAQVLKVNHIVIDSLMKCGIGSDDYNTQKAFVDRLCWAAKAENIHIHLVVHIRKGSDEGDRPGKFDIKGCSEITDLVDNVIIIHRNKNKEIKVRAGVEISEDEQDCTMTIAKQRHGECEPMFKFWFHGPSMQFTPDHRNKPMPFKNSGGDYAV